MAICSFIGHNDVYETDVYQKLLQAAGRIARNNDELEFLLYYYEYGQFMRLCLCAALEIKWRYPQKDISITFVVTEEAKEEIKEQLTQGNAFVPSCVVDKVISPPIPAPANEKKHSIAHKKIERWIMEQSTHIISYHYAGFHEADTNRQYQFAKNSGAVVVDIASPETSAHIAENIDALPEREKLIMEKINSGRTLKEVGGLLGISGSAVQQIVKHAGRSLRDMARKELKKSLMETPQPPAACSIFHLGPVNYETLTTFEKTVSFLISSYGVKVFHVEQGYCHSGYMSVLKKLAESRQIIITAFTHYPELSEEDMKNITLRYCPPCHALENIPTQSRSYRAKVFKVMRELIERSGYCICNLSGNTLEKSIVRHIGKVKGRAVFDISKKYAGTE